MAFVGLHAGIFFTMEVLGFSPISIAGLMAFIPATAWNLKPFRKFNSIQEAGQDSLPTEDSSQPQDHLNYLAFCGNPKRHLAYA